MPRSILNVLGQFEKKRYRLVREARERLVVRGLIAALVLVGRCLPFLLYAVIRLDRF